MEITSGIIPSAKKVVIYGPEGIGKSTFASKFPDPVFIDTEGSTKNLDVKRLPAPSSWTRIKEEVRYIIQNPNLCKTLVIDTADWAEKMAIQSVLDSHNTSGIEDFGYGNGYRYVYEAFGELLNLLNAVVDQNVNVVVTAHAILKKFEQPDELGAYDRYSMKLIDSPKTSNSAAVKEWADMVLFANYKTIVITDSKTKKTKAQGGTRMMYTTHHSCWDAKNRYGLAEELPFDFKEIAHIFDEAPKAVTSAPQQKNAPAQASEEMPTKSDAKSSEKKKDAVPAKKPVTNEDLRNEDPVKDKDLDLRIPKSLRDLMIEDNIAEWDIENFANAKGFVPFDTKIWEFEKVSPGIIDGLFVAQWTKVRDQIRQARKDEEIPFY